jgi:hypothetical protein
MNEMCEAPMPRQGRGRKRKQKKKKPVQPIISAISPLNWILIGAVWSCRFESDVPLKYYIQSAVLQYEKVANFSYFFFFFYTSSLRMGAPFGRAAFALGFLGGPVTGPKRMEASAARRQATGWASYEWAWGLFASLSLSLYFCFSFSFSQCIFESFCIILLEENFLIFFFFSSLLPF